MGITNGLRGSLDPGLWFIWVRLCIPSRLSCWLGVVAIEPLLAPYFITLVDHTFLLSTTMGFNQGWTPALASTILSGPKGSCGSVHWRLLLLPSFVYTELILLSMLVHLLLDVSSIVGPMQHALPRWWRLMVHEGILLLWILMFDLTWSTKFTLLLYHIAANGWWL